MEHDTDPRSGDSLGRLIARAGRRAEPPAGTAARVHAAVREEWQRVAHGRRRRKHMIIAAAAIVAFAAVGLGVLHERPPPRDTEPVAQVLRVLGDVRFVSPDGTQQALGGTTGSVRTLRAGDEVVTGRGAGVSFTVDGELSLRLGENSRLRWLDGSTARLLAGAAYVDSPPASGSVPLAGKFSIETEFGRVTHVGTQYLVLLAPRAVTVRVREGLVMVEAKTTREIARAREELTLDAGGGVTRAPVSPEGAAWSWVEALAAGFDVSQRSLLDFLQWTARETGRTLQFADARTRAQAQATILQGSTRGLSVGQALDSVMATTTLAAKVDGDRLLIVQRP